jgi:ribosomal protein L7/L12
MAEILAIVSLVVGVFAVSALVAARAREVRARGRIDDLEARVDRIAAHVGLAEEGAGAARLAPSVPASLAPPADIVALYAAGRKIEAIKLYRATTGLDLGGAKAALEKGAYEANRPAGGADKAGGGGQAGGPGGGAVIV